MAVRPFLPPLIAALVAAGAALPERQLELPPEQQQEAASADQRFFTEQVAPILALRCGECHGPDRIRGKGGLRFDGRAALLAGGDSGPALDLEAPGRSLLLRAVRGEEPGLEMPPDETLPPEELAILAEWVERGAPWPESPAPDAGPPVTPEQQDFFERRIRPVLAEHCFECHGPELATVESDFRLAGRPGLLRGGLHGPALDLGAPRDSRLLLALRYTDRHLRMPPAGPLPEAVLADFETWIAEGAPWPGYDGPGLEGASAAGHGLDPAQARGRWPYTPLSRPPVPAAEGAELAPIDAFVERGLRAAGLAPSAEAPWGELVRRLYVDLHGLPPTFEQWSRWTADGGADRYERLVDELLAAPEYGEHWAAVWLDLVRFAETNGYERDTAKPYAWRYRNYVVESFAADKPYDRFLLEQLAGDELDPPSSESLVATGFLRLGAWDDEPDDALQAIHDERDDVVRTVSEGFLGLTVGCARCHDHLFDPIPQLDYYRTAAFFAGLAPFEVPQFHFDSAVVRLADGGEAARERWELGRRGRRAAVQRELATVRDGVRRRVLEPLLVDLPELRRILETAPAQRSAADSERLAAHPELTLDDREVDNLAERAEGGRIRQLVLELATLETGFEGELPWTLAARERGPLPPPSHLLLRGRPSTPGPEVEPRFPAVLCASDEETVPVGLEPSADGHSSGRRLAFARWLTRPDHPLTARVMANRVWQHLFGRGLVATPNDFGAQGAPPSHPELLDWLAAELVEGGYRLKALQRTILLSRTYRQSSRTTDAAGLPHAGVATDPDNRWLWRQNLRRLTAEGLRDAMYLAAGELRRGPPAAGSFYPDLGRETLAGMSRPGEGYGRSSAAEQSHRALYAYRKRGVRAALAEVFDSADPSLPSGRRAETTTATQALVLWNGEFTGARAAAVTARIVAEEPAESAARVRRAFERVLGRGPSAAEARLAEEYLAAQAPSFAAAPRPLVVRPALPARVDLGLHAELTDRDALYGPRQGWQPRLGTFGGVYNGTVGPDPDHGPLLLRLGPPRELDRLSAVLRLDPGCEQLGLVLRARESAGRVQGIELRLEPERGTAALVLRTEGEVTRLAESPFSSQPGQPLAVELRLEGLSCAARVGAPGDGAGSATLETTLSAPLAAGTLALRVLGEGAQFDDLEVGLGAARERLGGDPGPGPQVAALESLVQLLFNSNPFVYVD
jgi:mono/diheme cytochrome c family protein